MAIESTVRVKTWIPSDGYGVRVRVDTDNEVIELDEYAIEWNLEEAKEFLSALGQAIEFIEDKN